MGERFEPIRIGDKLISYQKISSVVKQILEHRAKGMSQQEVANIVGVDRTFVSRLESIGEIRKGKKLALIGFPIANKDEITRVAREQGFDYVLVLTNNERWDFVQELSGATLFNRILELISSLQKYDSVIFMASDMRIEMAQSILGSQVIGIELGSSPLESDQYVSPDIVVQLASALRA